MKITNPNADLDRECSTKVKSVDNLSSCLEIGKGLSNWQYRSVSVMPIDKRLGVMGEPYYTVKEVAEHFKVSRQAVYIDVVTELNTLGIGFRSVTESIDTTTGGGKLIFHIFGALAEFERDLIRERTQAGLAAARARGRKGGRPRAAGVNDERKLAMAQTLYNDKQNSIAMICQTLRVSRATLYRYISVHGKSELS